MSQESEFRDYLYVSARKVIRMSRTLRTPIWRRVRDLQLTFGPVGAALTLDQDSRAEDVIALVPEVERAIEKQFGITYFTDPELKVGQWFAITDTPMVYGVPGLSGNGVLFMGEQGSRFILGGSAEYLLDRRVSDITISNRLYPSGLSGIARMLDLLANYDNSRNDSEDYRMDTQWSTGKRTSLFSSHFSLMRKVFDANPEPLSTLARCLGVDTDRRDNKVTVIGTPLYVTFDAPKIDFVCEGEAEV